MNDYSLSVLLSWGINLYRHNMVLWEIPFSFFFGLWFCDVCQMSVCLKYPDKKRRHMVPQRTGVSGHTDLVCVLAAQKAMAPHSNTLAWKIPWAEEPGALQSMGLWRVGHDWVTWLSLFTFMHWRRKWQPTPVFLPGESQGRGSLVGCHLWGRTEWDMTEVT